MATATATSARKVKRKRPSSTKRKGLDPVTLFEMVIRNKKGVVDGRLGFAEGFENAKRRVDRFNRWCKGEATAEARAYSQPGDRFAVLVMKDGVPDSILCADEDADTAERDVKFWNDTNQGRTLAVRYSWP